MNCQKEQNLKNFLVGKITDAEREVMEIHLADCPDCRFALTKLHVEKNEKIFLAPNKLKETVKNLPKNENNWESPFGFPWKWQSGFAVAGFVVLFSFVGFWFWNTAQFQNSDGEDILRQGKVSSNTPKLLFPEVNANLTGAKIDFNWKQIEGVNSYILIVSDKKGDIIFQKRTKVESLSINSSEAKLISGKYYFWYIRAKFIDGTITESIPRKFTFKN